MRRTLVGYDFPLSRRFRLGPWARGGVRGVPGPPPCTPILQGAGGYSEGPGHPLPARHGPTGPPPQAQGHVHTCALPLTMCLVCPWFVRPDKRGTEHEARGALTPWAPSACLGRGPRGPPPHSPLPAGPGTGASAAPGLAQPAAAQLPGSEGVSLRTTARAHTQAAPLTQLAEEAWLL